MLEGRAKTAVRDLQVKTNVLNVKLEELKTENLSIKDELAAVSHNQLMGGEQGMETLRLRNKFLQVNHFYCFLKFFCSFINANLNNIIERT